MPTELEGVDLIQTANDDDNSRGRQWLSTEVLLPVRVWVGIDARQKIAPSWLRKNFQKESFNVLPLINALNRQPFSGTPHNRGGGKGEGPTTFNNSFNLTDNDVEPVDTTQWINESDRRSVVEPATSKIPLSSTPAGPKPYDGVVKDYYFTASDVLSVSNEICRRSRSGGGEPMDLRNHTSIKVVDDFWKYFLDIEEDEEKEFWE